MIPELWRPLVAVAADGYHGLRQFAAQVRLIDHRARAWKAWHCGVRFLLSGRQIADLQRDRTSVAAP